MKIHCVEVTLVWLALGLAANVASAFVVPPHRQPMAFSTSKLFMAENDNNKKPMRKKLMDWFSGGQKENSQGDDKVTKLEEASSPPDESARAMQTQSVVVEPENKPAITTPSIPMTASSSSTSSEQQQDDTPAARAVKLRAEAEKARLEAARMEAELTLQKIERLEKELKTTIAASAKEATMTASGSAVETNNKRRQERIQDIQREMKALQKKMMGDDDAVVVAAAKAKPTTSSSTSGSSSYSSSRETDRNRSGSSMSASSTTALEKSSTFTGGELSTVTEPFSEEKFQETVKYISDAPSFLLKTLALQVEYDPVNDNDGTINTTELAVRFDKMNRLDFSYSKRPPPTFTAQQIAQRAKELQENEWMADPRLKEKANGNETKLALLALEYEYYVQDDVVMENLSDIVQGEEWLEPVLAALNKSALDGSIENLFPKCMRRDDGAGTPTLVQVQQLCSTVLPKVAFKSTSKPEAVLGGYIIRGNAKTGQTGDELIDAIEKEMARANLQDKMSVIYSPDFTVFSEIEETDEADLMMMDDFNPFAKDPILYVTGPDVVPEARPLQLSIVSGLGLATSWYLSIYPFLLNSGLAKRIDEELALVDAGMTPDLSWLTDLSVPLFASFLGIQLAHELGHAVVAGKYQIKTSVPTFVPSIITGVTSTVTYFKTLPKNKNELLDFAVAGPLVGMLSSIAAIAIGSQLTLGSDPSMLPALPLEILRQSTLGGGIIESILGNGVLNVPVGAAGTQAVAGMTIPLHPIAIAGYIGLVVNALSMLPIGTTDGGRVALALFGRATKLAIGQVSLIALLLLGILGSDLFLFYYAFIIAFQTGNEVPARNEVDKVDIPRAAVAGSSLILAILALVPFSQ